MSTKVNVLKALEENKGATISGEELAGRLKLSRAAIWKAIRDLRSEGYQIDAITNKGYCLSQDSDMLSPEGIIPHVADSSVSGRIHVFKSLESTNLTAKRMALEGAASGTVVIAEEQTKGRGRMGRSFYSPPSGGIYTSFILKPSFDASKAVLITTAASVAVCRAIETITGISCGIKWVNDIYMGDKKVCGILTEAVTDFESGQIEHIVLGIGINFSMASELFPPELTKTAGSLYGSVEGGSVSRNRLIAEVINQVMLINQQLESREFLREYKDRSIILGKEIRVLPAGKPGVERDFDEGTAAFAADIDHDGGLVVRYEDGSLKTLTTGEISIRLIN